MESLPGNLSIIRIAWTLQLRDKRKSSFARELYFPVVSVFLINQFYHRKKELKKSNKTSVTKEKKEASNF